MKKLIAIIIICSLGIIFVAAWMGANISQQQKEAQKKQRQEASYIASHEQQHYTGDND